MTAKITGVHDGILTLVVSGRLTQKELSAVQEEAASFITAAGKIRFLVLAENFEGWEQGGQWGDFSFQQQHDDDIERMAIVGEEQWRDLTLLFTSQGLRPFPIEYFTPGRLADARAWLAAR